MMRPNRPSTELKISMTRILTNLPQVSTPLCFQHIKHNVQAGISSIRQCRTAAIDAHTDTANQIAHPHRDARPEQRVAGIVVAGRVYVVRGDGFELRGEDDGHDDAVDGDNLAEDDRDKVLGSYSGGFDATANNGGAGDEDSPRCACKMLLCGCCCTRSGVYHAAPTTERPMQRAMPKLAHVYGDMLSRKAPT